ncbi:type II toxin-antitoxin system HigA family antitoxin [Deinococcus sp. SM5_A1]|uniref:helix-turn-helix domain-containing protein n=1 Tax=Deinococcus sp. SM5_A1 TaxID=3379094 RepID=UPI0038593025
MTLNLPALTEAWRKVGVLAPAAITPIENDEQLVQATADLKDILSEIGEDPTHPLDSLARSLIDRIVAYEAVHYPIPDVDAATVLRVFMQERHLTQQQLAKAVGISQSTISQLLGRRRAFTLEHVRKLAGYFGVKAGLFLPD